MRITVLVQAMDVIERYDEFVLIKSHTIKTQAQQRLSIGA